MQPGFSMVSARSSAAEANLVLIGFVGCHSLVLRLEFDWRCRAIVQKFSPFHCVHPSFLYQQDATSFQHETCTKQLTLCPAKALASGHPLTEIGDLMYVCVPASSLSPPFLRYFPNILSFDIFTSKRLSLPLLHRPQFPCPDSLLLTLVPYTITPDTHCCATLARVRTYHLHALEALRSPPFQTLHGRYPENVVMMVRKKQYIITLTSRKHVLDVMDRISQTILIYINLGERIFPVSCCFPRLV